MQKATRTLKKVRVISCLLILFVLFFTIFTVFSFADEVDENQREFGLYNESENALYFSRLSNEQLKEILSLKISDISNPMSWMRDNSTFVLIRKDDVNGYSFYWNVPNIQQLAYNTLYSIVLPSGYGDGVGVPESERQKMYPAGQPGKSGITQYGFNIPSPTYHGERPLVGLSIGEVIAPDGVLNGASRFGKLLSGKITDELTGDDLDTLVYYAPNDYNISDKTFKKWLEKYWPVITQKSQKIISDGEGADPASEEYALVNKVLRLLR